MYSNKSNKTENFVYVYNMPSEIYISNPNRQTKSKVNFMRIRKKAKAPQPVNRGKVNHQLKSNRSKSQDSIIKLKKDSKSLTNCCKISWNFKKLTNQKRTLDQYYTIYNNLKMTKIKIWPLKWPIYFFKSCHILM